MTPEGRVKQDVKLEFAKHGDVYYFMPVQNGMGAPSLDFIGSKKVRITPDMVGMEVGLFFAVETKADNKRMTVRQEHTANNMRRGGATVFLVNEKTDTLELAAWLAKWGK